jgi:hypothetical protein
MLSVLSAPRGNGHVADWGSGNIAPLCAFVKVTQRPISMDYHKNGCFLWNLPYCHVAAEKKGVQLFDRAINGHQCGDKPQKAVA